MEAGGDGNILANVPMWQSMNLNSQVDWAYRTEPDGKACHGMINQSCIYHRGRAIGGTSILNSLIYIRGEQLSKNAIINFTHIIRTPIGL